MSKEPIEQIVKEIRNGSMNALAQRLEEAVAIMRDEAAFAAMDNFEKGRLKGYGQAFDDVWEQLGPCLSANHRDHAAYNETICAAVRSADARSSIKKEKLMDTDIPQPPKPLYHVVSIDGDPGLYHWFYTAETEEDVIGWLDELLMRTNGFSLMSELNDIQCECRCAAENGGQSFPDKFAIPLKILNYAIRPYGLRVEYK